MVLDQPLLQVYQPIKMALIDLLTVAIVTAAYPESAAFMADESYNAIYPGCKISYTLSHYLEYLQQLKMKTAELNKTGKQISSYLLI